MIIIFIGWIEPVEREYEGCRTRGATDRAKCLSEGEDELRWMGWPDLEVPSHWLSRGGVEAGGDRVRV